MWDRKDLRSVPDWLCCCHATWVMGDSRCWFSWYKMVPSWSVMKSRALAFQQVGEIMDGRYEVFATHGKGVFSTVLRARDRGAPDAAGRCPEVAVKVIRANDIMYKAR